tara:strand:- start:222 stop:482 length:261 start_codon:yes stop_codon:yes gene_type:complete
MKSVLVSTIAAAALLFTAGIASADEASGRVTQVNTEEQTFTLDNGMTFSLSDDINIEGLAAGQEVKVTFEKQDSENIATEVQIPEN